MPGRSHDHRPSPGPAADAARPDPLEPGRPHPLPLCRRRCCDVARGAADRAPRPLRARRRRGETHAGSLARPVHAGRVGVAGRRRPRRGTQRARVEDAVLRVPGATRDRGQAECAPPCPVRHPLARLCLGDHACLRPRLPRPPRSPRRLCQRGLPPDGHAARKRAEARRDGQLPAGARCLGCHRGRLDPRPGERRRRDRPWARDEVRPARGRRAAHLRDARADRRPSRPQRRSRRRLGLQRHAPRLLDGDPLAGAGKGQAHARRPRGADDHRRHCRRGTGADERRPRRGQRTR